MNINTKAISLASAIGIATVFSMVGLTTNTHANTSSVDEINIVVPTSCTMNITNGNGAYNAEIMNGNSTEITGSTFKTTCNDTSGYAIYAIGYSGDTYTGNDHTKLLGTPSTIGNISTGTGTSGNSQWAMKLTASTTGTYETNNTIETAYQSYNVVPDTFTRVAYNTAGTDIGTNAEGVSITTHYRAYISATQPAGTYTGKVKYVLVHPNTMVAGTYTITYNANGGSGTTMPNETNLYNFEDHTLAVNTYTAPSGYTFAGWCTIQDQAASGVVNGADPQTTCTGTTYADEVSIPSSAATANSTLALYALWGEKQTYCTINSAEYCMQNVATWGSTLSNNQEVTAMDARDGKEYTVAKLADGNIWMTQNLDHDIGDIAGGTYTSSDTDISEDWTPSSSYYTYTTGTTTWNNSKTAPKSYDPGDLCWNGTIRSDNNGTISTDTTACGNDKHYHIGNYYNWTAAVAMSNSSSYAADGTDVDQSICPAGWRLPTYSGSKSYDTLVSTLSLTSGTSGNIQNSPVYFVYGGYWRYGSSSFVGGRGFSWSSVVLDGSYAYFLAFNRTGNLYPQDYGGRDYGISVRCVAR